MLKKLSPNRINASVAALLVLVLTTVKPSWSQDHAKPRPVLIELVGAVEQPRDPLGVTVTGKHAYVCAAADGLHVMDVSNPNKPIKVGTCTTLGSATDVAVRDQYAYVANGKGGFRIVDVSHPRSPKEVGGCETPAGAHRVALDGSFAYVAAKGLLVIDISNPRQPQIVARLEKPQPMAIAVRDKHVYLADKRGPLYVIDISDPKRPKEVASCETGENQGIVVQGKYAYLADDDSAVHIVDISNPAAPRKIWTHSQERPKGFGEAVAVAGDILYVGCDQGAIVAFDVSQPEFPIRVATFGTDSRFYGSRLYGLCAANGYLFVNSANGRLLILRTLETSADVQAAIADHIRALGSRDNQMIAQAHAALVQIGSPAIPALIEALNNSNKYDLKRCRAAALLSEIKPPLADRPAAARALIRALGEKDDWRLHSYAVMALVDIEPTEMDVKPAAVALMNVLRDREERPGVRASAADYLWRLAIQRGNARTVVPLLRQGLKDEDTETRKLVASALESLKAEWAAGR